MPNVLVNMHKMAMNLQKEKMRNRISVHRAEDLSKLHQEVGTEILPEELGGTNGNIEDLAKFWKGRVEANKDWLLEQNRYKTDESKRPGKPKLHADIFGMEESFRKLDID